MSFSTQDQQTLDKEVLYLKSRYAFLKDRDYDQVLKIAEAQGYLSPEASQAKKRKVDSFQTSEQTPDKNLPTTYKQHPTDVDTTALIPVGSIKDDIEREDEKYNIVSRAPQNVRPLVYAEFNKDEVEPKQLPFYHYKRAMNNVRDLWTGAVKSLGDAEDVGDIMGAIPDISPTGTYGDWIIQQGIGSKKYKELQESKEDSKALELKRREKIRNDAVKSVLERQRKYEEDYINWLDKNPEIQGMLAYEQDNPVNFWNPLTWDAERITNLAQTGALEVLSNLGIGAATYGVGVIPYNAARILGSEFSEDLAAITEKNGLSPEENADTALTSSVLSTMLQMPLEYIGYRHVKRVLGPKLFDKARRVRHNKISTRLNKDISDWKKKNPKKPLGMFIKNQKDNLKAAAAEGFTEYSQFIADRITDKYTYDEGINVLQEAISQEAAQDFLAGFFGAYGVTTGADLGSTLNMTRQEIVKRGGLDMDKIFDGIGSIWKDKARTSAPNQETADYAEQAVDMIVDQSKKQTIQDLNVNKAFGMAIQQESQRRSDDAIVIEAVTNKENARLSIAEKARLAELQLEILEQHPDADMDDLNDLLNLAYVSSIMNPQAVEESKVKQDAIADTIQELADQVPEEDYQAALELYEQFFPTQEDKISYEVDTPDDLAGPPIDVTPTDIVPPEDTDMMGPDDYVDPDDSFPIPLEGPEEGMVNTIAMLDAEKEDLIAQGAPDVKPTTKQVPPGTEIVDLKKESLALKSPKELKQIIEEMELSPEGLKTKADLIGKIINAPEENKKIYKDFKEWQKTAAKTDVVPYKSILPSQRQEPTDQRMSGSTALSNYMKPIQKNTGSHYNFLRKTGKIKLPEKLDFTHKGEKHIAVKATNITFRNADGKAIDPDMGFYNIIDESGRVVHENAPLTTEAIEEFWDWQYRTSLAKASKRKFNEFLFGGNKSVTNLSKVVGKRYSPLVSGNLASQRTLSEFNIKKLPEDLKLLNQRIIRDEALGLPLDDRQIRNRKMFLDAISKVFDSAKPFYTGENFDEKVNTILSFFEYLPKHVFNNLITMINEFDGQSLGYATNNNLPINFVAPWRGVLEKVYEIRNLDKSKIDLINSDVAFQKQWFVKTNESGIPYINREQAIINHLVYHHKLDVMDAKFALDRAREEIKKEVEAGISKKMKDKTGLENGFSLLPIMLSTFGKDKVSLEDNVLQTPFHELVHHIEMLAKGTKEWEVVDNLLKQIANDSKLEPLIKDIEERYEKDFKKIKKVAGRKAYKDRLRSEILAHIMQRMWQEDLGIDSPSNLVTDQVIDNILNEKTKGKTLYERIKDFLIKIYNKINAMFKGKPYQNTKTVLDNIND